MNRKDKLLNLILIAMFAGGVGLIGWWFFLRPKMQNQQATPNIASVEEMTKYDKKVLTLSKDGSANEAQVADSLRRISFSDRAATPEFVEKYKGSSSPQVRAAAIEAAGATNDPAMTQFLAESLKSSEKIERIASLKALTRHQSEEHIKIVSDYLQASSPDATEKLWAQLALAKLTTDTQGRAHRLTELLSGLSLEVLNDSTELGVASREVTHQVLNVFQRDYEVIALAEEILQKATDDDLAVHALQYAAAYDDLWLKENFVKLPRRESSLFQSEVLGWVNRVCPPQHKDMLQTLDVKWREQDKCR